MSLIGCALEWTEECFFLQHLDCYVHWDFELEKSADFLGLVLEVFGSTEGGIRGEERERERDRER